LEIVICASTVAEVKKVALLKPEYIAYEPAELIGGEVSVTTARPGVISEVVDRVRKISLRTRVLCGAGVHSRDDLYMAIRLGASGVLLAHAIVKAKDPTAVLKRMLR
jgi:triosephosphate isomerase